jgi:hypothetical protein
VGASLLLGAGLVMTAPLIRQAMTVARDDREVDFVFTARHAWLIGAVCFLWLALSGIGGWVRQDYDWGKHNVILNSLMLKPWPVIYEIYHEQLPLVYYIAYYLPAALVGKVGGWFWANQALFVWSFAGLYIALLWFCILMRRVSFWLLALFVVFSGLDVVGRLVAGDAQLLYGGQANWRHIDSWAGVWQYSSNTTLLFWVPHQALAGWVLAGTVLYCLVYLRRRDFILLPIGLSAFWSPFVTLGMIPYLVVDFLFDKRPFGLRLRQMATVPNLIGLFVAAMTALYFAARIYQSSPLVDTSTASGFSLSYYSGSLWVGVAFLLFFCLLEFGLYVIIIYASRAIDNSHWRLLFHTTVLVLCLLPWLKIGVYNDLVMRASIPALFVLTVTVAQALYAKHVARGAKFALIALLVVGCATPAIEAIRHLYRVALYPPPLFDETQAPGDLISYFHTQIDFFGQYSGGPDAPFYRFAAKTPALDSAAVIDTNDYILYGKGYYMVLPGQESEIEIQAGTAITIPLDVHIRGRRLNSSLDLTATLVDPAGHVIWRMQGWPGARPKGARSTIIEWHGELAVSVPVTTTPGSYALQVGIVNNKTKEFLPAESVPAGEPLGEMVTIHSVEVKAAEKMSRAEWKKRVPELISPRDAEVQRVFSSPGLRVSGRGIFRCSLLLLPRDAPSRAAT